MILASSIAWQYAGLAAGLVVCAVIDGISALWASLAARSRKSSSSITWLSASMMILSPA